MLFILTFSSGEGESLLLLLADGVDGGLSLLAQVAGEADQVEVFLKQSVKLDLRKIYLFDKPIQDSHYAYKLSSNECSVTI